MRILATAVPFRKLEATLHFILAMDRQATQRSVLLCEDDSELSRSYSALHKLPQGLVAKMLSEISESAKIGRHNPEFIYNLKYTGIGDAGATQAKT